MLGRALAALIHPVVAWRLLTTPWRCWIVAGYTGVSYTVTLLTLLVRGSSLFV
jgi:hypothetical protein